MKTIFIEKNILDFPPKETVNMLNDIVKKSNMHKKDRYLYALQTIKQNNYFYFSKSESVVMVVEFK
jgi:hypothetical protein